MVSSLVFELLGGGFSFQDIASTKASSVFPGEGQGAAAESMERVQMVHTDHRVLLGRGDVPSDVTGGGYLGVVPLTLGETSRSLPPPGFSAPAGPVGCEPPSSTVVTVSY